MEGAGSEGTREGSGGMVLPILTARLNIAVENISEIMGLMGRKALGAILSLAFTIK